MCTFCQCVLCSWSDMIIIGLRMLKTQWMLSNMNMIVILYLKSLSTTYIYFPTFLLPWLLNTGTILDWRNLRRSLQNHFQYQWMLSQWKMTIGPVKSLNFPREYSDSSQNIVHTGCVIEMKCCLFLCIYVLPCCASTLTSLCYIVEMNPFSISDINNQTTYNRKTFIHTNFFSNSTASL